jgi:hypothetical protein
MKAKEFLSSPELKPYEDMTYREIDSYLKDKYKRSIEENEAAAAGIFNGYIGDEVEEGTNNADDEMFGYDSRNEAPSDKPSSKTTSKMNMFDEVA